MINGVLEWIPETLEVVVDEYEYEKDINSADPRSVQLEFLKKSEVASQKVAVCI